MGVVNQLSTGPAGLNRSMRPPLVVQYYWYLVERVLLLAQGTGDGRILLPEHDMSVARWVVQLWAIQHPPPQHVKGLLLGVDEFRAIVMNLLESLQQTSKREERAESEEKIKNYKDRPLRTAQSDVYVRKVGEAYVGAGDGGGMGAGFGS